MKTINTVGMQGANDGISLMSYACAGISYTPYSTGCRFEQLILREEGSEEKQIVSAAR